MPPDSKLTKEAVIETIKPVMHPEITLSLLELGIVHVKEVANNQVLFELAIPFPQVPAMIINIFKRDLSAALEQAFPNATVDFTVRIMTEEERSRFLKLEQEHWKGFA